MALGPTQCVHSDHSWQGVQPTLQQHVRWAGDTALLPPPSPPETIPSAVCRDSQEPCQHSAGTELMAGLTTYSVQQLRMGCAQVRIFCVCSVYFDHHMLSTTTAGQAQPEGPSARVPMNLVSGTLCHPTALAMLCCLNGGAHSVVLNNFLCAHTNSHTAPLTVRGTTSLDKSSRRDKTLLLPSVLPLAHVVTLLSSTVMVPSVRY